MTAELQQLKFDSRRGLVWRGEILLAIEPKGINVLRCLAAEPGKIISAEQLREHVWRRRHIGDGVISQTLYKLRRALGDETLIQSVRGQGWRLRVNALVYAENEADVADLQHSTEPRSLNPPKPIHPPSESAFAPPPQPSLPQLVRQTPAQATWLRPLLLLAVALLFGAGWLLSTAMRSPDPNLSIAVMPFLDRSSDQSLLGQATGLTLRFTKTVQRFPGIHVISEYDATNFRGDPGQRASAEQLGANLLLTGELSPQPQGFELTTRLIDHSGHQLGYEQVYQHDQRDLEPLFERARQDLYQRIGALAWKYDPGAGRGTRNPEAFMAYLRAAPLISGTPDEQRRAKAALELAVELDPNYADAWADLGGILGSRLFAPDDAKELQAARKKSIAAMDRAISLAPNNVDTILMRSELRHIYLYDWEGSAADLALAEKTLVAPTPMLWIQHARLAAARGDLDQAIAFDEQATEINEKSGSRRNQGWHLLGMGRYQDARTLLLEELKDRPWESSLNFYLGLCDVFEHLPAEALKRFQYAETDYRLTGTAIAHFELGDKAAAQRALDSMIERTPDQSAYEIASVFAWFGESDAAFEWLDRAFEVGDGAIEYLYYDPRLRKIRDDPRMRTQLIRLKHPKVLATS